MQQLCNAVAMSLMVNELYMHNGLRDRRLDRSGYCGCRRYNLSFYLLINPHLAMLVMAGLGLAAGHADMPRPRVRILPSKRRAPVSHIVSIGCSVERARIAANVFLLVESRQLLNDQHPSRKWSQNGSILSRF